MNSRILQRYIERLNSTNPMVRHEAAEALSNGDERAIYPLIKGLYDENIGVQDAAMRSLISIGGEVTAYMVLPLLREEAYVRNTAIIILQNIGLPAISVLKPLLKDKDDDVRKFAIDIISNIGFCDYKDEIINLLQKDPNPNVRASAAKAIEVLKIEKAEDALIAALDDDEWVAFSALHALSVFKSIKAVKKIAELIKSPHISIRVAAIEALNNMESLEGFDLLIKNFFELGEIEQYEIVKGLIKNKFYEKARKISNVEEILLNILKTSDWQEKLIAMKGLVLLGFLHHLPEIIDMAGSLDPSEPEDEEKFYAVIDILRQSGCNDFFVEVIKSDKYKYRAKVIAIELIGELRCEKAIPYLIELLKKDFRDIRRASISALSNVSHDREVQRVLLEMANDPDSHVRKTAIINLGKIGKKDAFITIWEILINEKYTDIITECFYALENIDKDLLLQKLKEAPSYLIDYAKKLGIET